MATFCAIWDCIRLKSLQHTFCQHLYEESGSVDSVEYKSSMGFHAWSMQSLMVILTEFHFSIVGQQNVLTFDVPMNNSVCMQIGQATKDLSAEICNPLFSHRVCFGWAYQVSNGTGTTELKYNPQLVIFARWTSFDECTVVCGNITMVRILHNSVKQLTVNHSAPQGDTLWLTTVTNKKLSYTSSADQSIVLVMSTKCLYRPNVIFP